MSFLAEHEAHREGAPQRDAKPHDPDFTIPVQQARSKPALAFTEDQAAILAGLPKKAASYLVTLWKRGMPERIKVAALKGQNPFPEATFRPAHVAYNLLMGGGFTKAALRTAFQECLGWGESSAYSQVSITWRVFCALGIAVEDGCRLVPHPNLGAQNVSST